MHDKLLQEPMIAVDTESNSMYAYRTRVCLIQLSTRTHDYILDPLTLGEHVRLLADIFEDERIEKVFHAAEYDLICLQREYGFQTRHMFDTMYAARLVGQATIGLNDIIQANFGFKLNKSHQLDNWGTRPLKASSLRYAQTDTHYLIPLRDIYQQRLAELGALEEAADVFADLERVEAKERPFDPEGYWQLIRRDSELSKRDIAVLSELYILRERIAEEEDRPPFKVIENQALLMLAKRQPTRWQALFQLKGVSARQARMYGDDILRAVERGLAKPLPEPPRPPEVNARLAERYMALYQWRKERATQRALDAHIIMPKNTLWELAEKMPRTPDELAQVEGIGAWRLNAYGQDLLNVLKGLR
jgi:ribonuclease D